MAVLIAIGWSHLVRRNRTHAGAVPQDLLLENNDVFLTEAGDFLATET